MTHTCHAKGCEVSTPRALFMCKTHWYMLPKRYRDAVWLEYTVGQENDVSKVSADYLDVSQAAINWLAEKEGK